MRFEVFKGIWYTDLSSHQERGEKDLCSGMETNL
jgi:hypothetical protein